jgi:putative transposase
MARIARVVVPGYPHHITQRGNRRQKTFFCENDYQVYIELMSEWAAQCDVEIWAYCLIPNHVHLVALPQSEDALRRAIGEAHRRYTRHINFRKKWRGHLWQGRFASYVMDESYLIAAVRYIELNPVRAGLTANPAEYRWSSAAAHINGYNDGLVNVKPLLDLVDDWQGLLDSRISDEETKILQRHERTGRPLGSLKFVKRLEQRLGKTLIPQKGGRPKKVKN